MIKKFLIIAGIFVLLSFIPFTIKAQELPTPSEETQEIPELPQGEEETPAETPTDTSGLTEENTQSFINGAIAGGIVGLVFGGAIVWIFKNKMI